MWSYTAEADHEEGTQMQTRVLVAYTSNAGSTAEVAEFVARELRSEEVSVEVRRVGEVTDAGAYGAVVVGGPMMMGWHAEAVSFLEQHQQELSQVPVACFMTALSLTQTPDGTDDLPVFVDPALAKPPKDSARLSYKERFATTSSYLQPILEKAPKVRPVSVAFFGGKLDFGKLNLFQRAFVGLVVGARQGDFRNWTAIRSWTRGLQPLLLAS
jgi:menaquinone-dependent protoporphyrinogen oxidase